MARAMASRSAAGMPSGGMTGPGATAFTCTSGASSLASARVSPIIPALETQYGR